MKKKKLLRVHKSVIKMSKVTKVSSRKYQFMKVNMKAGKYLIPSILKAMMVISNPQMKKITIVVFRCLSSTLNQVYRVYRKVNVITSLKQI